PGAVQRAGVAEPAHLLHDSVDDLREGGGRRGVGEVRGRIGHQTIIPPAATPKKCRGFVRLSRNFVAVSYASRGRSLLPCVTQPAPRQREGRSQAERTAYARDPAG